MGALERLQDLLDRATPLPWVKATDAHGHGPASDGPCWSSTVTAGDYVVSFVDDLDATADADTDLIALAPVLASDLIALARKVEVIRAIFEEPAADETWDQMVAKFDQLDGAAVDAFAALSTVLAHIDDSLPESRS